MRALIPLLACGLLLLAGCSSTLSKDECRAVDWRTVGYEDGVAGYPAERIADHRRSCAKVGVAPDLEAYRAGRAEGLREFCQPRNGYRAGVDGRAYDGSCPADLAPAFDKAYDAGRELYVRTRRVDDANARLSARRAELARLENGVVDRAFTAMNESATAEDRTQAVLDAKQAGERIGRLKREIVDLEKERDRYQRELDDYRATVAANDF